MSTMIQNPNEIEAFTRRQRALARIHRNIAEKFQLNRRQFISGSLATMALAALGLSGCAPKTPAASTGDAAPAFTPGTYEATAQGRNGEIKVSVTFEADRIASIEADHMESRNIGDAAVRLLTDNYLDTQKLSVDTVTGATLTSMAFATAVAECAEAAGADMRAIMKGDASVNAAEPINDEADVVVIGSGGAALAAAVTAADGGVQQPEAKALLRLMYDAPCLGIGHLHGGGSGPQGPVLPDPLQQLRHAGTEKALSILQKAGCQLQFHGIPPVGLIKSLYHIPPELQTGKERGMIGLSKIRP